MTQALSITLSADTYTQLQDRAREMFPALAATVSVGQSPSPDAKELITLREGLAAAQGSLKAQSAMIDEQAKHIAEMKAGSPDANELIEARANLAKLEDAYQALVAKQSGDVPGAIEALALVCDILGAPRTDYGAVPQLVRELKDERDLARKEANEAIAAAPAKRATKAKPAPGSLGALVPDMAAEVAPDGKWANDLDPAKGEVRPAPTTKRYPDVFLALPNADLTDGAAVVVLLDSETSPTGWATPGGTIRKHFVGSENYEVELAKGGCEVVTAARIRGASARPVFVDTDAPVTAEDRANLGALAKELQLDPAAMKVLITETCPPKTTSAELTVSELGKLQEAMRARSAHLDQEVPF